MLFSKCGDDASIGPTVHNCRDGFDFTIHFENVTFAITPSAALVVVALVRMLRLWQRPAMVLSGGLLYPKMVCDHTNNLTMQQSNSNANR